MLQDADARSAPLWLTSSSTARAGVPKIARDAVARNGLERWLKARAGERVRVVRAQAGAGKTTGTVLWARSTAGLVGWIDVPAGCSAATLDELFANAIRSAVAAHVAGARGATGYTIVIDQVDDAGPDARESLRRTLAHAPDWLRFILIGRSQRVVDVAGKPHAACDAALLRFSADEVGRLCEAQRVATTPAQIDVLLNSTSGWAAAVAGAVRAAAFEQCALATALKKWRATDAVTLAALVERALDAAPEQAALLAAVLAQPESATPAGLAELASCGLFVDAVDGRPRLNPIVAGGGRALIRGAVHDAEPGGAPPATITLLGEFRMCIAGRAVRFSRRRDRQLVQYLALRPDGRATRDELGAVFWPHADRHSRGQGLRTACSMIRAALARCGDRADVERYFRVDATHVTVRVEHLAIDAHRFQAAVERAVEAEVRGDAAATRSAWGSAAALYTAPLLHDEPVAPWFAERASAFAAAAARARGSASAGG